MFCWCASDGVRTQKVSAWRMLAFSWTAAAAFQPTRSFRLPCQSNNDSSNVSSSVKVVVLVVIVVVVQRRWRQVGSVFRKSLIKQKRSKSGF